MNLRDRLYDIYLWLERRIAPELRSSQLHYRDLLAPYVTRGCRWLDLGCGHSIFGVWMDEDERTFAQRSGHIVGIDLDWAGLKAHRNIRAKVYGDLRHLPFPDGHFDVVTANMVAEHLSDPVPILKEVRRVLRPGGMFVFHTPNFHNPWLRIASLVPDGVKKGIIYVLEGRQAEDVFPTHYQINTAEAVRQQAALAGLEASEVKLVSSSALTQMIPPVVVFELLFIRMLQNPSLAWLRTNLVCALRKPS